MGAPRIESADVWDLAQRRAAATPDALMLHDGARGLTFAEYRDAAEEVAAGLAALGVRSGDVVSWQLTTTLDAAVLIGALARLGAVQNPIVPVLRRREVEFMVRQTGAGTLVVPGVVRGFDHGALARQLEEELGTKAVVCDTPGGARGSTLPTGDPATLPPAPAPTSGPQPVRWIYYTSGTTSDPKGARHVDRSVIAASNAYVAVLGLEPDDSILAPIPITHIGGMMLLGALWRTGASAVIVDQWDPVATPALAAEMDVTVAFAVGPMFRAFVEAQQARGTEPLLPRLKVVVTGGAALPVGVHDEVKAVLGGSGVVAPWGLTEAPVVTFPRLDADDVQRATTVGPPVPGVELRVVASDGTVCGPGQEGELRVMGPQLFSGYVDASLDADALDADGYLRTGDLGTVEADGYARVTGRLKDVVIRNGENISAQEVEQLLLTHPVVVDVAVIGLPDPRTGERACAVLQLAAGSAPLTVDDLRVHCRAAGLATHKHPEQVEVIDLIPRNGMGKAQKQELKARFAPTPSTR